MIRNKQLGVFCKVPVPGKVKTRLCPPLTAEQACDLYAAFLRDLFGRLAKSKKTGATVFFSGGAREELNGMVPDRYELVPQVEGNLGDRLVAAFSELLGGGTHAAVIIGSDSPDLPLPYLKRAFVKLKHKDVVLGPSFDGGYYLVGSRAPHPDLFSGIAWGGRGVFGQTVERVRDAGLSLALLPMWYDVDTPESLGLLRDVLFARRVERSGRLPETEAVLSEILPL